MKWRLQGRAIPMGVSEAIVSYISACVLCGAWRASHCHLVRRLRHETLSRKRSADQCSRPRQKQALAKLREHLKRKPMPDYRYWRAPGSGPWHLATILAAGTSAPTGGTALADGRGSNKRTSSGRNAHVLLLFFLAKLYTYACSYRTQSKLGSDA